MEEKKYMTDAEENLVKSFAKNQEMREAVKKFLCRGLFKETEDRADSLKQWIFQIPTDSDDVAYAQHVKLIVKSLSYIQDGFERMEDLLEEKDEKLPVSEAR